MKNALVVYNIQAGRKKSLKYKKILQKFLRKNAENFKFITIDELNNIEADGFDTIIAMGGDGTIHKVLPLIVNNSEKTLAIIPCGTANLLAAKLGINNVSKALSVIERANVTKIDVMKVNDKFSVLRCGLGYDADIISKTSQTLKNKFGYFAYFITGLIFALKLKNKDYTIIMDNKERNVSASCIIIANVGNMYKNYFSIGKKSNLQDGLMDIFILKTQNPILFFIEFLKIIHNIRTSSIIAEYMNAKNIKIKKQYLFAHIDGEKTMFLKNLDFGIETKVINIYK